MDGPTDGDRDGDRHGTRSITTNGASDTAMHGFRGKRILGNIRRETILGITHGAVLSL